MGVLGTNGLVDWESESYPVINDFILLPFFSLFFPSVRLFLDTFVFEKLAKRLIFGNGYDTVDIKTREKQKKIRKFKESAWKCVYFLSAELFALYITYDEPWFTNTKFFWVGSGDQTWPDLKYKFKLKGLYMYAGGFYTYSIFALIFWETRRKDFSVSMGHHVASLSLIVLSYIFRFARVGSVVLALHDASDVFLEVGKMSKYSGCEWLASIAFPVFVISWTILRIIIYPFWVLWSTSCEVLLSVDMEKYLMEAYLYYYIFNTLLFCLLVLNIYWWILMVRMAVRQIQSSGKVEDDVRSDSEDEGEHDD